MAVTDSQKIDYIWKKVGYGVAKTDTNSNKFAVNEGIASPLLGRGDTIWQRSGDIPGTKPSASTDVVQVYSGSTLVECTADTTATVNRTWLTNETDWIGIEFGATYLVEVFIHTAGDPAGADDIANKVFITGSGSNDEWYFDYQAGVVNFIGTNLPSGVNFSGKSVYVKGARYIGPKGLPTVPTTVSALTNDAGYITGITVGADDSTMRFVGTGESIKFIGGDGISTSSDAEGNITITNTGGSGGGGQAVSTFSFSVGADDSTLREISNDESIQFIGGTNISTTSDAEGNITITNDFTQDFAYGSLTGAPTSLSDFTNDSGFITAADLPASQPLFSFGVAGDDSTIRTISTDESIKFIGATGITTATDSEGNVTITGTAQDFAYSSLTGTPTIPSATSDLTNDSGFITAADVPSPTDQYSFSVGADDSTMRVVGNDEGIKFIGGTNISTTSDAEGNITITNDFTQDFAYSSLTGTPTIPSATSDLTNDSGFITAADIPSPTDQYKFSVGADDSTLREISNDESVKFIGGTNISTASDSEGNITITNDFTQDFAYGSLTGTPTIPTSLSELTNDVGFITTSETFSFGVAADDSTIRTISNNESIKFIGATGITTASDAEGDITVAGNIDGLGGVTLGSQNEILIVGTGGNTVTSTSTLTIDDSSNFIGINQTSPATTLHMTGESSQSAQIRMTQHFDGSDGPDIRMFTSRGTEASPTASQAGDNIGRINVEAYDGSSYNNLGTFGFNASTATSSTFDIRTRADGVSGLNERFAITGNGEVRFADAYTFPTADGNANQVLQTDGSGNIDFATIDYANIANTPTIPSATSDLSNDSGFITASDVDQYKFSVGADDSTLREVSNDESIRFVGGTNISTASDAEGNITITNDFTQDFAYGSLTGTPTIPTNVSQLANDAGYITDQFNFSIAADDSTQNPVSDGEAIKISGGTFTTTSSDGEGNITINSTLANLGQLNNDYGYALLSDNVSNFPNDAGYITETTVTLQADDSTTTVGNTFQIQGAEGISTSIDDANNVIITGTAQDFAYASLTGAPTNLSDFTNDQGFITSSSITLAADDSSSVSGDSFQVVGGQSISTSIDASNNIEVALDSGEIRLGQVGAGTDVQTITTNSGHLTLRSSSGEVRLPSVLTAANRIPFSTNNNGTISTSSNFTYIDSIAQLSTGNLVLSNNATLGGNLIFEGSTEDANETTIQVTDPTADRTITIKDESGTMALISDIPVNIEDLSNVSTATPGIGQVLTWGGSQWEAQTFSGGGGQAVSTFSLSVGADDSTLRVISTGESIKFSGGDRITTASDAEGNITITGEVPATLSQTPPSDPVEGDIWWETDSGQQYVYYDGYWVEAHNSGHNAFSNEWNDIVGKPTFASVATSGDYNDLTNLPTYATVATSGSYDDLVDKPTILEYSDFSVVTAGVPTGNGSLAFNQGTGRFTHTPANVRENLEELDNVSTASPGIGQVLQWGGSQWEPADVAVSGGGSMSSSFSLSVGADDSTLRAINSGESIKFIGGTNISTTSDAEGNITINNDGTSLTIGENAPSSPNVGELWWESDSGNLYVYYDSYWVQSSSPDAVPNTDGFISLATLKEVTAASTDFNDFQARIAAL